LSKLPKKPFGSSEVVYAFPMQVQVLLFAKLKREAGVGQTVLELPEGASVREAAQALEARFPLTLTGCMAAINEVYATPDARLSEGDAVAFLPPVAGG